MIQDITLEKYTELKNRKLKRAEIAEFFGIPEWKLKKLISANGWGKKLPTVDNIKAFKEYTAESAYWAGFIAADGYISDDNTLQICLNFDDTKQLETFKNFTRSSHKITSNTTKYYRSSFGFKNLFIATDLLRNYNITPRKSLTYEFPTQVPEKFLRDFIRGYFDGDGCICESFSNKNSHTATLYTTICGSNSFINSISNILKEKLNITGSVQLKENHSVIKYCTNKSLILLNYMYKDSNVYLDRKYNLYKKVLIDRKIR